MAESEEEEDDFFAIRSGPIAFGASLKQTAEDMRIHRELCQEVDRDKHRRNEEQNCPPFSSSSKKRTRKRSSNLSNVDVLDLTTDDDIFSPNKKDKNREEDDDGVLSSPEVSFHHYDRPPDYESMRLLQAAEFAAYNLSKDTPLDNQSFEISHHDSFSSNDYNSSFGVSNSLEITLRVRCQGKVHKFTIDKSDPLSLILSQLADTLNTTSSQIILQLKSHDLDINSCPQTLGLTSVDILDAFVVEKPSPVTTARSDPLTIYDTNESFTIKLQAPNKSIRYTVEQDKPLEPTLRKFVAELSLTLHDVSFSFDGEKINKDQSPNDLDMENDDVIDVWIIAKKNN